jgi:TolC family type I secretion outer membrane protein
MPLRSAPWALGLVLAALAALATPAVAQAPPAPSTPRTAPAPGQVLSLQEAIDLALRQQPTIRSAQQSEAAAGSRVTEARSGYFPRFDVVGSAGRSQTFSSTLNQAFQSNAISTVVQGRQLIYDFGKLQALVDTAQANQRVATNETQRVRDVVVLNVRQAYYNLLQAQRLVAVADAQVARSELNLRSARGFFDVGTKPKSDVTKAEVEVANARVAQIQARNLVQLNQVTLANALGLEASTPFQVQDILNYEAVAIDPVALRAEALANRPELVQAQARIDAARAQLAGARAGYLPDLTVTGSYGAATSDPPLHEVWSVTGNLSWNLFQGFFTAAQVEETGALVEAARADYDSLELQVRLDVEQAYINVLNAAERITATAKAVESAQENLRLAQGRYDAGVGTILDLTDAQLSLTNAEADQVRALTDHKLAQAALDRAVGRSY